MIFLAGRDRHTQRTLLRAVHDRLSKHPGCENVRYRPSRRRPRRIVTDLNPAVVLGNQPDIEYARVTVRFWYPDGQGREYYRINWIEPERNLMVGFHQDADHPDMGPCHLQLDYEETPVDRHAVTFRDGHPLSVLEVRLQQLPAVRSAVRWQEGRPSLPEWPT